MSGKRHHTIPQFLLSGFKSSVRGKELYTWLYRKGATGIEINIKNVGVEGRFYSQELDDQITDLENQHSVLVQDLLSVSSFGPVDDPRIPVLITHLCLRTRQLRQSLTDTMVALTDGLRDHLGDKRVVVEGVRRHMDTPEFRERVLATIGRSDISNEQADGLIELLKANAAAILEQAVPNHAESITEHFAFIRENTPAIMRDAHISSLAKDPNAAQRAATYAPFRWFLIRPITRIHLGDTVCLFETTSTRRFKPLDDGDDRVQRIYLPLAPDRILVGTPYKKGPKVDAPALNKAIVRCSYEFFVSANQLPSTSALPSSIGKRAGLLSEPELQRILREIKSEWPLASD